jgi:hypothetical protein
VKKPPIGIMSEQLWREKRMWDLIECLARHRSAEEIPFVWLEELYRHMLEWRTITKGGAK